MKKVLVLALLSLVLTVAGATAGTLSSGLERQMAAMADGDEINVLVVLKDQVDIRSLNWELHDAKTTRAQRHAVVLDALQSTAAASQAGLLADLGAKSAAGLVRAYRPYWLINGVRVATTVAGARELAARPDVDVVEADLQAELIQPIRSEKTVDKSGAGIGITPGVVAVGARRVWDELGIDGTGVVVGILDTGVDGAHPALSARWRGNFAPAAECWFDAIGDGSVTPTDGHYHGTHVMGTITGLAADDTIGVAPGALWIASNVINQGSGSAFDNDVVASLQFMTDPDGNPATLDDVPDVVQNSWGVNENFSGYVDCDSRWWTAIDACEAAGVVLTWSAGNEGPGSQTLRSPGDRATDAYNAFSVGSTIATAPYTISSFSSRGPSGCGGAYATKPEVVAPGSDIYSAQPGGGYQLLSGTSMAGPHVAGVVALMRAANPSLDVITIKQILMETATDLGAAGEEDTYGHGMVNAYEAVLAVMTGFGTVEGTVTAAGSGTPLSGVTVTATAAGETTRQAVTDAAGAFQFMLPQGGWNLDYSAFGYLDAGQGVTVVEDATVNADQALTAAPSALLSGTVYDDASNPLTGATVTVLGAPVTPAVTDGAGFYSLSLPTGTTYDVLAQAYGFGGDQQSVVFNGAVTRDFVLPTLVFENFESGGFLQFPWAFGGTAPWIIDAANAFENSFSARSGAIDHNQSSTLTLELEILAAGNIEFEYKVSSESTYDFLRFFVDGAEVANWSGEVDWSHFTHNVGAGLHTFSWSYTKDGSVDAGADAAWIDYVIFPTIAPPAYPDLVVDPASLATTLDPGASTTLVVDLDNLGEGDLIWTASAAPDLAPPPAAFADPGELPKDAVDPRPSQSPLLGSGGPDGFGYSWIDSDEVGGPSYAWVDISASGTPQGFGDDENQSFPLSFPFSFYGVDYTSVNVCSNGFIAFGSTSTDYTNDPIPTAGAPDNMVAVMWDDFNPGSAGTIYTLDDPANGRFIVQWDAVPYYSTTDYQTFQVILNADGSIVCQYETVTDRASATYGIENAAGTDGLQIAYNAAYAHDGLAVEYSTVPPPTPWLTVAPTSGTTPGGASSQLTVTLDAAELAEGVYTGNVTVSSNDPANPVVVIPVTLTVTTVSAVGDLPERFALDAAYPNPFNPQTRIAFAVPAGGARVRLDVFDVSGRLVKRLVSGEMEAGHHAVTWSGDDRDGRRVASGTYFYRLQAGSFVQTRSLVLVK